MKLLQKLLLESQYFVVVVVVKPPSIVALDFYVTDGVIIQQVRWMVLVERANLHLVKVLWKVL